LFGGKNERNADWIGVELSRWTGLGIRWDYFGGRICGHRDGKGIINQK